MATLDQVHELMCQLNEKTGSLGRIVVYSDQSGHYEDGNDDEVFSWDDYDEALEAFAEELEQYLEWAVESCDDGCCWFLVNEQQGLRYPISGGEDDGQAAARQLAKLANRDFGDDYYIPAGSQIKWTQRSGKVMDGFVVAVDKSDDSYPYNIAYVFDADDPRDPDDYNQMQLEWVGYEAIKLHPRDNTMRLKLLDLAKAYAINIEIMGLLT